LNTQANFQVLTAEDYIVFDIIEAEGEAAFLCKLSLGDQQGTAYDSLPALINTHIVRSGQLFTSMFNNLHKLVFIHKKPFQISAMTYNFRILLGYIGIEFPIQSHDKKMWVTRKSAEAGGPPMESAQFVFPINPLHPDQPYNYYNFYTCRSPDRYLYIPCPVKVLPADCWDYRVSYELDFTGNDQGWCTILESSGTVTVNKDIDPDTYDQKNTHIIARIYEGSTDSATITLTTTLISWGRNRKYPDPIKQHNTALNGKPRLLFGEATRYALRASSQDLADGTEYRVKKDGWTIDNVEVCSFYGTRTDRSKEWESNSCLVIAGYKAGKAILSCGVEYYHRAGTASDEWIDDGTRTFEIEVLNDQIEVLRQELEPPMVGSGLSTTELYLLSNCGTQSYRNSLEANTIPNLYPAQVSAIISNAFSPSFPVQTSSDIIGKIPTSSLSNLWFRLVDANFVPIKLLNPLYLSLSVNPIADESEDLTPFLGKLPKDRPTPQQAQAMAQKQAEEAQAAEEQKQTSGMIQEVISGLVQQYKEQKARADQQRAMYEAQVQQQQQAQAQQQQQAEEQQLLLQGYTPEQIQQAYIEAQPPPPPPPPPTEEEIQQAQNQEKIEILEAVAEPIS
jgi:hypothetical protein